MKRAVVRIRLGYRKWVQPLMMEYFIIVVVFSAITIKFKGQIEERFFKEKTYYQYYDRVEPNIRNHPYIEE